MSVDELVLLVREKGKMRPFVEGVRDYICNEHGKSVDCKLVPIEVSDYASEEFKPHITESIRRKRVFYITDPSLNPSESIIDATLTAQAAKLASADEVNLILTYMPWLRQDLKDKSRVPISARAVVDILSLYANRCVLCDPHFKQIQGFFDIPTDVLSAYPVVIDYLQTNHPDIIKNSQILTADGGGNKRIGDFAKRAGLPLDVLTAEDIQDKRDPNRPNEVVRETVVYGEVKKPIGLVVEDIIDTGTTLIHLAKGARKRTADGLRELVVYATHFVNSNHAFEKLKEIYDLIVTTDTIPTPPEERGRFEVVSLKKLFGEAIYRVHAGESVDSLFDKI
ncbi:MAG: ribose-phosphate diphosphokinase [Candidatus Pacearchaeota archaeon]|nr:ribose-phosphate diphosphokinase [Candidatus Pacearchaeota archaeon]